MTSDTKMLLHFCPVGVTLSWEEAHPGARASRPHQAWHSLDHLPHLDQPGTAPWLSFGLADAVLAHRVAACSIALKLSGNRRDSMRAGRPRSRGCRPGGAVGSVWRATSQKADLRPLGNSHLPASPAPAPHDGADHPRVKQVLFQTRDAAWRCWGGGYTPPPIASPRVGPAWVGWHSVAWKIPSGCRSRVPAAT